MKKAVHRFGKPRIELRGDLKGEIYTPWVNAPIELSVATNDLLDRHYKFGNVMYSALAGMDEEAFPRKSDSWWMKCLRVVDQPIRDLIFARSSKLSLKQKYEMSSLDKPGKNAFDDITLDQDVP